MTEPEHSTPPEQSDALLCALDLGSNSFHMIIARIVQGAMQVVSRRKESVRLSAGLDEDGELSEEALVRGVECLERMGQLLRDAAPAQVRVVATHALREARNRDLFLSQGEQALGYPIEVIPGKEEARLIYQGVAHNEVLEGCVMVVDIGGGSTEFAIGEGFEPHLTLSRSMGCVSFTQRFFEKELSEKAFRKADTAVLQELEASIHKIAAYKLKRAFATSGSAKALSEGVEIVGGLPGRIRRSELEDLRALLIAANSTDPLKRSSVSADRYPIFAGGLAIMLGAMKALSVDEVFISEAALREGVLYEMDDQMRHHDIRLRTRESLQSRYHVDIPHAQNIASTCDFIFERVADAWGLSKRLHRLLHEAAQLHEVGLQITASNLQRHSSYILENCDMPGYNQEEQIIISLLVGQYRKRLRIELLPTLRGLNTKKLVRLIRILRLAAILNVTRSSIPLGKIDAVQADGKKLSIQFEKDFLGTQSLLCADLESEQDYMAKAGLVLDVR